jgi:hypothetical protein
MYNKFAKLDSFSYDASSRIRVGQLNTLLDGKTLGQDNTYLYDNQGTGTGTFSANTYNMSVTSGQYRIRQTKLFCGYSSGKSQLIEATFDNFQVQANTTKRVGYFSSNAVAPYDSNKDGVWLENDGTTFRLIVSNNGTVTKNIPITSWDNYGDPEISGYDWSKFTVIAFDFLWLGGATLRLFLKTPSGFKLCHTISDWAGISTGPFMLSPNQPIRYEIRSTTGTGSFKAICCQVASEGNFGETDGVSGSITSGTTGITLATIGTTYPIVALRKQTAFRDTMAVVSQIAILVNSADQLLWSIQIDPTISGAGLTYSNLTNSNLQSAIGNGTLTVTTPGKVLAQGYSVQNGLSSSDIFKKNLLSNLMCSINNTPSAIVLCGTPLSATVTTFGLINFKEYSN